MLPVLINLPFLKIYTYGVFLVLAFFWGAFLLWKNFLLTSYKEEDIFDALFVSLAGGLFFSRLIYVIFHFDKFGFSFLRFILINGYPGLSLYGFLIGAIGTLYLYFLAKKIKFRETMDYFAPALFLALGFGKIGAFLSGAEVGSKTSFFLAVKYVGASGWRHATPLYEGIMFFLGAFIAYRVLFAIRRDRYPKGFNFSFFAWYVSAVLFAFDFLKQKDVQIWRLGFNGIFSAVLLLTFTFYFLYYFKSFLIEYGKNIGKVFHRKTEKADRRGKDKNSSSN